MKIRTTQNFAFLGDLVSQVRIGRLVPASFQRPYVWGRHDIEELWTSIVSGDPLGGLLLWSPETEEIIARLGRKRLGPIEMLEGRHTALILDGQNRLISLAWSMVDPQTASPDSPGFEIWNNEDGAILVADPVTDPKSPRVCFIPKAELYGLMMPVWKLFDNQLFNQHLREQWDGNSDDECAVDWLSRLQESVKQARVVISTIEGGTAEQAKRRLLRIARVGVPISEADFDQIVQGEI